MAATRKRFLDLRALSVASNTVANTTGVNQESPSNSLGLGVVEGTPFGYPRPQLERSTWTSLNGPWRFLFDDDRAFQHPTQIENWPMIINVPFPPESKASGIHDTGYHNACWYQRDFHVSQANDRIILRFGAVDYGARVWMNNHLIVTHEGGHTPFSADITTMLDASGRQTLTVLVDDDPHDLTKPRGKQDWQLERNR